jgi:hypothetical protein
MKSWLSKKVPNMSNDIPQDDEPLFLLKAVNESSLEKFDQRMSDLIEFATTQHISAEVRDECVVELEQAKKNGYRIY